MSQADDAAAKKPDVHHVPSAGSDLGAHADPDAGAHADPDAAATVRDGPIPQGHALTVPLDDAALYRSAAVAQVTGLPVATLRMWERRYRLVSPTLSAGGHRRYRAQDVRRLALLKHLVDGGHAISAVAPLGLDELAALAAHDAHTHRPPGAAVPRAAPARAGAEALAPRSQAWWVVGSAIAARLRRPAVWSRLQAAGAVWAGEAQDALEVLGGVMRVGGGGLAAPAGVAPGPENPASTPSAAWAGPPLGQGASADPAPSASPSPSPSPSPSAQPIDPARPPVLVIGASTIQPAQAQAWVDAVAQGGAPPWAVVYGFASADTERRLRRAGALLRREPVSDAELVDHLLNLTRGPDAAAPGGPGRASGAAMANGGAGRANAPQDTAADAAPPPRRYSDEVLTTVAAIGTDVACDCPRHVAELLLQLARFEDYSAQCVQRSPADAALHQRLHRLSGQARRLFEQALEAVAAAEGIALEP